MYVLVKVIFYAKFWVWEKLQAWNFSLASYYSTQFFVTSFVFFLFYALCWDTPTEDIGLWQLPKLYPVSFERFSTKFKHFFLPVKHLLYWNLHYPSKNNCIDLAIVVSHAEHSFTLVKHVTSCIHVAYLSSDCLNTMEKFN